MQEEYKIAYSQLFDNIILRLELPEDKKDKLNDNDNKNATQAAKKDEKKADSNAKKPKKARDAETIQKEESIDARLEEIGKKEKILQIKEQESIEKEEELRKEFEKHRKELERISGMTSDEAKDLLLKNLENEVKFEATKLINKIEEDARRTAEKKGKEIVVSAMQRSATEHTS